LLLLPPSRHFAPRRGVNARFHLSAWFGHLKNPALPLLFAIGFLVMGAFVTIYNYIGFRLVAAPFHLSQAELGMIFSVYLFGIIASWAAGMLGDRVGPFRVLPLGLLVAAAGCALTLSASLPLITLGVALLTVGFFVIHSMASALVGRLAQSSKGHASSLYLLAYYLGSSVAGSIGGVVWAIDGWPAVVVFTLCLLAGALVAGLMAGRLAAGR